MSTPKYELKKLAGEAVGRAVERAEHYRLLNDPEQAESIALDVLEADPDNQRALIVLILALTDQFTTDSKAGPRQANALVKKLEDEYARLYYGGLVAEREARAFITRSVARSFAYESFQEAMGLFEKAAAIRPAGNDDAILRWNSCARTIMRERLEPRPEDERELMLE